MKDQGFPSKETRNSGSKVNFLPTVKLMIVAGFPKVKIGTTEIPLLVIKAVVANWISFLVLSTGVSAKLVNCTNKIRQVVDKNFIRWFSEEEAKVQLSIGKRVNFKTCLMFFLGYVFSIFHRADTHMFFKK